MSEMICTCRADGVLEVEARRLRIFRRMGLRDMGDLTTAIILSLAFDFQADASIGADMWFGVSVDSPFLGERGLDVECDWVHDGLAALWEQLAEKFPEWASVCPGTAGASVRVAERISDALLSNYLRAEEAHRAHREQAHRDDNDCSPCEDCDVTRTLSVVAHCTLNEAWGSAALDRAVEVVLT